MPAIYRELELSESVANRDMHAAAEPQLLDQLGVSPSLRWCVERAVEHLLLA
jgi:hypothetical protein